MINEILNKENEDSKNVIKNEHNAGLNIDDHHMDHNDLSDDNDENILDENDSEDEPIAPKSRKRKKVPNNDVKIESNHSQLMSK